jgi:pseudaminic acid cytidylyltransferase
VAPKGYPERTSSPSLASLLSPIQSRRHRVIVSTDDEEIAEIARRAGAEVPFMRPAELSDDNATTIDVIAHALNWAEAQGPVELILCIYATAPFVTAVDLDASHRLFEESGSAFAFSATEFAFPIQRAFRLIDGKVQLVQPEHSSTRSQDLPTAYHDAGQFYWCRPDAVKSREAFFAAHSSAYLMERHRVQDIDTPEDWIFAERLFALQT